MWTEETIEALKQLALEGRSASAIALALGAPSRNAVIGKAHRIGIKLNGRGHASASRGPRAPREPRLRVATHPRPRSISYGRGLVPAIPRERERKAPWIFAGAEVGEMLRVGFEDIRGTACRWPIGDPTCEDFVYCGLEVASGRSYCAGHCRMAYKPPKGYATEAPRAEQSAPRDWSSWRQSEPMLAQFAT
jgi:GcrA cell cycle regulator